MYPFVSVVVVSHNEEKNIGDCLDSVISLGYPKELHEIIVVDSSLDETKQIVSRYPKVKLVDSSTSNLAVKRNIGFQQARGEYIAFTDADCIVDHKWISEFVKGYVHKDVKAVGGSILDKRITNIWELSDKGHDFVATAEGNVSYIVGCNMSFDSNVLRKYMFNDELKYGYEEALLCDYLIDDGYKIYYRPQAVVYHKHRSNLIGSLRRKYLLGMSSIWYRKKQNMFIMFKRHFIFLNALFLIPFFVMNKLFLYLSLVLFLVFSLSLLRDEIIFNKKSIKEIIITFPFLIVIEFSHFAGSVVGLVKFKALKRLIIMR